ncbi:MAG: TlpA disulfide reductase family protein [Candidatus Omnitrophota bacterium]|jgi:peroxiredoxin
MMKAAKFMFVVLLLFSFAFECRAAVEFPLAYEFKLNDLKGSEVSLSSYKDKKAVVLIFWTTYCYYCRNALKSLQADSKSLNDLGAELLAVNVGESERRVNRFAQSFKLSLRVLLDQDASVADHYGLLGVPTYVIINKSGRIVFSGNRFSKEKLKELAEK